MTEPPAPYDRVTISCTYGDDEKCRQIMVYLNYDDITAEDITAIVEAAFNASVVTIRNVGGPAIRLPRRFWNDDNTTAGADFPPRNWFGK